MVKKILTIMFILLSFPVQAGVFENAYNSDSPVFLYLYSSNCGYCQKFESRYRGLIRSHSDYKFVKVDAATPYGHQLMASYDGLYVPYIVLTSKKLKKAAVITPKCAMNDICTEQALKNFKS